MLKRKIYYFAGLLLFFLTGCNAPQKEKEVYEYPKIEINNKVLKDAIIEYQQKIFADNAKRIQRGDSAYVSVWFNDINDSIARYVISPVVEYGAIKRIAPFFVARVDGHDVFVTSGRQSVFNGNRVFDISEDDYLNLLKRYLPNRYREYQRQGGFSNYYLYEPDNCYLTFINDSLIDKTYQRGLATDGVWVNINGKKVYL